MGRIRLLPPEVAELIAAGEVVERPASVVKELCENALDAHARRVDVELEEGGRALVAVTDDGEGMAADDAQLAFQRHATSKIRSLDDLAALRTLGFRGEALPSLAAVARVRLLTCRAGDEAGLQFAPGAAPMPSAAPPGTRVEVRDLFHNVPARRKALRSAHAELAACAEVVAALALCRPDVAFSLRHAERSDPPGSGDAPPPAPRRRELLRTHGSGALEDAVLALWGHDAARALLPIRAVEGGLAVRGVVGQPSAARANRGRQVFCVNGRPVRSDALRGATEAAFRGLLMVHRYPAAVLAIDCDPGAVDVNVHPSKLEVRFADFEAVRRLVHQAVRATLQRTRLIPDVPLGRRQPGEAPAADPRRQLPLALREGATLAYRAEVSAAAEPAPFADGPAPPPAEERPRWPELRPVGQIAATYILAEGPDGLYVLDQHAAHERVFFEAFDRSPQAAQPLAVPQTVHLDALGRPVGWGDALRGLGFDLEEIGGGSVLVRAVPAGLTADALPELIERLASDPSAAAETPGRRARRAMASCKAAIKANQALSMPEMQRLLADLAACGEPFTCPHGRPTILRITVREMERHFRRI